jgi:hypothetical protein
MVSVPRFVQDEPVLFKATQDFVSMFAGVPDPVLSVAGKAGSLNAKIAWTLLGTVLFQDRSYTEMARLMEALYAKFPDEALWTLPVPAAADINDVVSDTFGSRNWSLFEHVAGIFWSVGLFARRHPDLAAWARERTPEEMWRDLGEIYFMGKKSVRPKACAAIYRLLAPAPLGLGMEFRRGKMPPLPLTMGARRFLAILGPARDEGFADLEPEKKQKLANEFFAALCKDDPYRSAHALQFFLEAGEEDFICREKTGACANCPLYVFCDYALRRE